MNESTLYSSREEKEKYYKDHFEYHLIKDAEELDAKLEEFGLNHREYIFRGVSSFEFKNYSRLARLLFEGNDKGKLVNLLKEQCLFIFNESKLREDFICNIFDCSKPEEKIAKDSIEDGFIWYCISWIQHHEKGESPYLDFTYDLPTALCFATNYFEECNQSQHKEFVEDGYFSLYILKKSDLEQISEKILPNKDADILRRESVELSKADLIQDGFFALKSIIEESKLLEGIGFMNQVSLFWNCKFYLDSSQYTKNPNKEAQNGVFIRLPDFQSLENIFYPYVPGHPKLKPQLICMDIPKSLKNHVWEKYCHGYSKEEMFPNENSREAIDFGNCYEGVVDKLGIIDKKKCKITWTSKYLA